MADDRITISAIARVIDMASGPLKSIQGAIGGVGAAAAQASAIVGNMGATVAASVGNVGAKMGAATGKVVGFTKGMAGMFGPIQGLIGLAGIGGGPPQLPHLLNKNKELLPLSARLRGADHGPQAFPLPLRGGRQ